MYFNEQNSLPQIVICIPINLKSKEEIALALLEKYGTNYLFLGEIFQDRTTNKYCLTDISDRAKSSCANHLSSLAAHTNQIKYTPKTELANSFALLGQDKISETTLKKSIIINKLFI